MPPDAPTAAVAPPTSLISALKAKAIAFEQQELASLETLSGRIAAEQHLAELATEAAAWLQSVNPSMASAFSSAAGYATKAASLEQETGL